LINGTRYPRYNKTKQQPQKQQQQNNNNVIKKEKQIAIKRKVSIKKSPLLHNIQLLKSQKQLDMLYGLNIKENGEWYFANSKLKYNNNTIIIDKEKWKLTPGLFQLLFHTKPAHYSNLDFKNYRDILLRTNAHKRKYQNSSQVKGSKSFKYQHIIKNLFKPKTQLIGKGLLTTQTAAAAASTKSYSNEDRGYKYWDDPNELLERLRLLLASESAGNTNHKNEIISIIEELREANIIK